MDRKEDYAASFSLKKEVMIFARYRLTNEAFNFVGEANVYNLLQEEKNNA